MSEAALQQAEFGVPDFCRAFPERPELLECVTLERPLHTGKNAGRDRALCRAICVDLLAQRPRSCICADYQVGWETVGAIEALMHQRGELRDLGQTIRDLLGQNIVLMGLRIREALIAGEISPAQLSIPMAALIDKKAQLDAGIVAGTDRTEDEVTLARVEARFALIRAAVEADSGGKGPIGPIIDVPPAGDTRQDTPAGAAGARERGSEGVGAAAAGADQAGAAAEGGGGVAPRAPVGNPDRSGLENSEG